MITAVTSEHANASREFDLVLGADSFLDARAERAWEAAYANLCKKHNRDRGMPINWAQRDWRHQMEANLADVMLQKAMAAEYRRMVREALTLCSNGTR